MVKFFLAEYGRFKAVTDDFKAVIMRLHSGYNAIQLPGFCPAAIGILYFLRSISVFCIAPGT